MYECGFTIDGTKPFWFMAQLPFGKVVFIMIQLFLSIGLETLKTSAIRELRRRTQDTFVLMPYVIVPVFLDDRYMNFVPNHGSKKDGCLFFDGSVQDTKKSISEVADWMLPSESLVKLLELQYLLTP